MLIDSTKKIVLAVCVLLFLSACSRPQTQKKILFLGDSYTVGTGLASGEAKQNLTHQLVAKLEANNVTVTTPTIYAVDGDTTKHLLGALNALEPQSNPDNKLQIENPYDLVILSIGINDVFRGHSLEDYEHHFAELLERSIQFTGGDLSKIIVLSIPAWDASPSVYDQSGTKFRAGKYAQVRTKETEISIPVNAIKIGQSNTIEIEFDHAALQEKINKAKEFNTKNGIAQQIDLFNQAARAVILEKNKIFTEKGEITFIDLTPLTRDRVTDNKSNKPNPLYFAQDGIHYSPLMYEQWVEAIFPIASQALKSSSS